MRGCCIYVTGEIKDVAHQWRHHREIGDNYEIRPIYQSIYMVRMVPAAYLNRAAMSLLSANFPIYGDVLLIRIIEGFIFDATFDEIASDLITEISVSDAPIESDGFAPAMVGDVELTRMTNPAMVGSDVSSDEDEYDESYDSD